MGFLKRLLCLCNHDPEPLYYDSDGEEISALRPIQIIPVNEPVSRNQTGLSNRVTTLGKGVKRGERVWWKEQVQTERRDGRSSF
jgi:hypothetical protein